MFSSFLKKHWKKIVSLIIVLIIYYLGYGTQNPILKPAKNSTFYVDEKGKDQDLVQILQNATSTQYFKVAKVVDGDTFVVDVDGGLATIRTVGINTPETVDPRKPVECFGPEASKEGHSLLDGQTVSLSLDPTQDSLDKYGRVLAYAYLPNGDSYNETMVKDGFAYEYTYQKAYQFQTEFKSDQYNAQKGNLGLWATSTCDGKK